MITYDELKSTKEYWITHIQLTLYACIKDFMEQHNLTRTELAHRLGVTKGYVTQLLNGNFDHRLSKLVELSLAIGMIPQINFIPANEYHQNTDRKTTNKTVASHYAPNKPVLMKKTKKKIRENSYC